MNFSDVFIRRPDRHDSDLGRHPPRRHRRLSASTGRSLPSVDIPTIRVMASRPGADPATMAESVAAPLERRLGEIAGVTEITSVSSLGSSISPFSSIWRVMPMAQHATCRQR